MENLQKHLRLGEGLLAVIMLILFVGTAQAQLEESPWPVLSHDIKHTGQSPYQAHQEATIKWKYQTGASIRSSPVISSDGTIYVASCDKYLYALRPNGTLKWKFVMGGVGKSPAINSDGTIYVGTSDKYLYALNSDGNLKWKFWVGGRVRSSLAIGRDGTIYMGLQDSSLCAVNANGTLKWKFQTRGWVTSSPAIDTNGTIFVGSWDNYLYAINTDGSLKWKFQTEGIVTCSPAIDWTETIYIGSFDNHLYAINPDGTLKWKFRTGSYVYSLAISSNGTVYAGTVGNKLYAISLDGMFKWKFQADGSIGEPAAICSSGTVYISSSRGFLYAINSNGTLKWKSRFGNDSPLAIASNGTIYFGCSDGNLYAIGPAPVIFVSETEINFGTVQVDSSKSKTLIISNNGGLPLSVNSITSSSIDFEAYPKSFVLPPNSNKEVKITFKPLYAGNKSATLTIFSNDFNKPEVTVSLIGEAPFTPNLYVSDTKLDFDSVKVGSSRERTVNVNNIGQSDLEVTHITVANANEYFKIISPTRFPRLINPNEFMSVILSFTPHREDEIKGELVIKSNDPNEQDVNISLQGFGIFSSTTGPNVIIIEPADHSVSKSSPLRINGTVDDLSINSVLVSDCSIPVNNGSFSTDVLLHKGENLIEAKAFDASGNLGSHRILVFGEPSQPPQDKVKLNLRIPPSAQSNLKNNFLSEFSPPNNALAEYKFFGTGGGFLEWSFILLGDIQGNRYSFSILLSSLSTTNYLCSIILSQDGKRTTLASTSTKISSRRRFDANVVGIDPECSFGDSLILRISFDQYAYIIHHDFECGLFGCSSIPSYITIPKVKSEMAPVILVTPSTINFDEVIVGGSKTLTFNIINNGKSNLVITGLIQSLNRKDFNFITPRFPINLKPYDASLTLATSFTPLSSGEKKDKLIIENNDPENPNMQIILNGIGGYPAILDFTDKEKQPRLFALFQNYPNPFNPETTIEYQLAKISEVTIKIYNMAGQLVKTLVDQRQPAGYYSTNWKGRDEKGYDAASGVYFYKLEAKDFVQTRKMLLVR